MSSGAAGVGSSGYFYPLRTIVPPGRADAVPSITVAPPVPNHEIGDLTLIRSRRQRAGRHALVLTQ